MVLARLQLGIRIQKQQYKETMNSIEIVSKGHFTSIEEFKLLQDIGVGSFGKVKLGIHLGTRRRYAIKIIDLNADLTPVEISLILREIKVHSKLDHPHIVKLWDTLLDNNKIYMIMDYAQNGSLFNYHSVLLKQGTVPSAAQVYQFFYQTLQAVKYLHSVDIMHRDIKPQNLLLDENYNIKLCDFGWATNQINSPRSTFCGTYEYMAPEMILEKSYDYKIDIWALGVLLFELVHGKAPFQAENVNTMRERINVGSYEISSSCSESLKDLIIDILQFKPSKRLGIKQIQSHEWVKQSQRITFDVQLALQIIGSPKTENKISKPTKKSIRKHQHQQSMGNFMMAHQKQFKFLNQSDSTPRQQLYQADQSLIINYQAQKLFKKHRRNITQPIMEPKYQTLSPRNKMEALLGSMGTEAETPIVYSNQESLMRSLSGANKKLKTQNDSQDFQIYQRIGSSKKALPSLQQLVDKKKKRSHLRTETGPILSGTGVFAHTRNFSSQLKDNQQIQKAKKKQKTIERGHQKAKKVQERTYQVSNKLPSKIKQSKIGAF